MSMNTDGRLSREGTEKSFAHPDFPFNPPDRCAQRIREIVAHTAVSAVLGTSLLAALATPGWAAFEAYSPGDLNGQNGWDGGVVGGNPVPFTNNNAASNVVTNADAATGVQSWRYSGSYGSPGAGTPFTRDVATVGAPNAATVFAGPSDSPITPAGDQSVVSFAFRAVAPGDASRFNVYEGSFARDARTGANLNLETSAVGTVRLYFFDLSSTDECANQDFPTVEVALVAADSWHTVKMTTTYPDIVVGDLSTYGSTTYVVDEGTAGEITVSGNSSWAHGFNYCGGTAYTPGGSVKFSNGFNDYPVHQGFYIDDLEMVVIDTETMTTVGSFATSFELCTANADCDDTNTCTDDTCDTGLGCQHTNNTGPCTDGDACTTEMCSGGTCVGGAATDCDDTNECTDDSCDSGLGCQHVNNTEPCTDGNECTSESCSGGACTTGAPTDCGDANACTDDTCHTDLGCQHTNNTGPCTDGDACTTEVCAGGSCVGGAATDCDDANLCTSDSCSSGPGCEYANVAGPCDDDNACTLDDTCFAGTCTAGEAVTCGNPGPCATGSCDPETGDCTVDAMLATGCLDAGRSALQFSLGGQGKARWKWNRGEATACTDFDDPSLDTNYDVCVYDEVAPGVYELVTSFYLPANPAWEEGKKCRWSYLDKARSIDGIRSLNLEPGAAGDAAIRLDAGGANTPMPTPVASNRFFAMNPSVTVQLVNGSSICWQSTFTEAFKNTGVKFKTDRRVFVKP